MAHTNGINPYPLALYGVVQSPRIYDPLCVNVAKVSGVILKKTTYKLFSDGTFLYYNAETARDHNVFIIFQPRFGNKFVLAYDLSLCYHLVDALMQAAAYKITVVIPCLSETRQDKKSNYREPVLVHHVGKVLKGLGADSLVVVKIHNPSSLTNFPMIRMTDINTEKLFAGYIKTKENQGILNLENLKIVSTDSGGIEGAKKLAIRIGIKGQIAMVNKDHLASGSNVIQKGMGILGDVSGYDVFLYDDMFDTCGSIQVATNECREAGAKRIFAGATHGLFTGKAVANINNANLDGICVTDSCFISKEKRKSINKLEIITTADLVSKVVLNIHNGDSVEDMMQ